MIFFFIALGCFSALIVVRMLLSFLDSRFTSFLGYDLKLDQIRVRRWWGSVQTYRRCMDGTGALGWSNVKTGRRVSSLCTMYLLFVRMAYVGEMAQHVATKCNRIQTDPDGEAPPEEE